MKLKTLALLAASAIGLNVNALDLNQYYEYDEETVGYPTVLTKKYFSNSAGEVYQNTDIGLKLIYKLEEGSILINEFRGIALGYITPSSTLGSYFLCPIERCDDFSSRTAINNHRIYKWDTWPYGLASQNSFSSTGISVVKSRWEGDSEYTVSAINKSGEVLDSFKVLPRISTSFINENVHTLTATTGITLEENFKLLTADHGEYMVIMKEWDAKGKAFIEKHLFKQDGLFYEAINFAYTGGVIPIAISNPMLDDSGEKVYRIVLGELNDRHADEPVIEKLIWGMAAIEEDRVIFKDGVYESDLPISINATRASVSRPYFHKNGTFTFENIEVDLSKPNSAIINQNKLEGRNISDHIILQSSEGVVALVEPKVGFKIFSPGGVCN